MTHTNNRKVSQVSYVREFINMHLRNENESKVIWMTERTLLGWKNCEYHVFSIFVSKKYLELRQPKHVFKM